MKYCDQYLDVLIKRNRKHITFSVYRKSTSTTRYITKDSYCQHQQKLAAFNAMANRLCKLPLSLTDYRDEYNYIMNVADTNGFERTMIEKVIRKHSNRVKKQELSTLFEQNQTIEKINEHRVGIVYAPKITNPLKSTFERNNMKLVHTNNKKLRFALGTTKDDVPFKDKSGIYEISCSDCEAKYIGQTKRALHFRIDEHHRSVKNKEMHKAIPAHVFNLNNSRPHDIGSIEENVKLVKGINKTMKLDAYESLFIHKNRNLMNLEGGNIESILFNLV